MRVKNLSQQSMGGVAFGPPNGEIISAGCPAIRGICPEYPNNDNQAGIIRTMGYMRMLPLFLVSLVALILGGAALVSCKAGEAQVIQIPFEDARIKIEFNSTAEDVGVQVFLDGEAWRTVMIVSPDGNIFEANGRGSLKGLGLTELFFESQEPTLDELPLGEFLALFPEGEYEFRGVTVEGDSLVGTATLTHDIPCGPVIVSPDEGDTVDPDNTKIEWESVTNKVNLSTGQCGGEASEIVGYQVIVEREDPLRTFSVDLPASATDVTVPPEFLEAGTEYKFEVLAIEVRGNQTISESFFCTDSLTPCAEPE
jgi:hypothetical protein